jgi:hypothetical protein
MNSRIIFSLGTFAVVRTVSNLFHPWRVLLTPTVQMSTAWADDAEKSAGAAINATALVRDGNFIIVYSKAYMRVFSARGTDLHKRREFVESRWILL